MPLRRSRPSRRSVAGRLTWQPRCLTLIGSSPQRAYEAGVGAEGEAAAGSSGFERCMQGLCA